MKRILKRAAAMCPQAARLLRYAMILSCVLLACSLAVLLAAGEHTPQTHLLYIFAEKLYRLPQSALLLAVLGSAIIEDYSA